MIQDTLAYIETFTDGFKPEIGIVLGSGLGVLKEDIQNKIVIEYKDIPGFPISTVEGHAGELIIGELSGKTIIAMNGRFHYYEGYDMEDPSNVGSKVVRELKSPNTQDDTIRYDFIKMLITPFLSDVDDFEEVENDFSIAMTFNTMVNMGFIKEIN